MSRIIRYDNIEANLDNPPAPVVVFDALPKDEPHGWKFMKLSPDGNYLYFQIGTPANITVQPVTHAVIVRLNLKTNVLETVAQGVRNSVGMDFHPTTKELWFTNNARDWVNDDLPNDTLNRITRKGMNFGYPFCHQGDLLDIDFGKGRSCDEFDKPVMKIGPHVAALGMRFYTGKQFPAEYKNNIFIAEHGSWNRTKKSGFDVVRVALDAKGNVTKKEVFVSGWIQGDDFWGRPADVHVMKDGSMLVSDDVAGGDAEKIARGQHIAQQQYCSSCHGAQLQGQKHVPRLSGQSSEYFVQQLRNLRSGARADMDGTMASAARSLTDEEIEAMAVYTRSLP